MDEAQLRLACVRLVMPDVADPDIGRAIEQADQIYQYIKNGTGAPKRRARTPKADKLQ